MDKKHLRAIQHYNARTAIGSSSMRGAGSAGVVDRARVFLGQIELRPFGTSDRSKFLAHLDDVTENLRCASAKIIGAFSGVRTTYSCGHLAAYVLANLQGVDSTKPRTGLSKGTGT